MITNNKIQMRKLLLIFLLLNLIFITPIFATSLDEAKDIVNNYYLYSQQKDVEKYSELFDKNYVVELYGEDYKNLFTEIFTYYEIEKYEINYQYYTESEDSLSLFFNLEANTIVDGNEMKMDNDLVALFSKTNNELKLKYIILQETFIEQMNREVIYNSAIESFVEENSNLIKEAEAKNIPLVDYTQNFENMLNENKFNIFGFLFYVVLIGVIILAIGIFFKEKITHKKTRKHLDKMHEIVIKTSNKAKDKFKKTTQKYKKSKHKK